MSGAKMIGCRVSNELDKSIRAKAAEQGKSVNQFLVDTLGLVMQGNPHFEEGKIIGNTNDVVKRIREIRAQIDELEGSKPVAGFMDKGLFGLWKSEEELEIEEEAKPIEEMLELLRIELEQLITTITEKKNSIKNALASRQKISSNQE